MPDREPYRSFNFRVEIDGINEVHFAEVEIPPASIAVVEIARAGTGRRPRATPATAPFGNVAPRRGIRPTVSSPTGSAPSSGRRSAGGTS